MTYQKRAEEDEGDEVGVGEGRAAGLALVLHDFDAQGFVERNLGKKIGFRQNKTLDIKDTSHFEQSICHLTYEAKELDY
jgi:hypothetical protein